MLEKCISTFMIENQHFTIFSNTTLHSPLIIIYNNIIIYLTFYHFNLHVQFYVLFNILYLEGSVVHLGYAYLEPASTFTYFFK